GHGGPAAQGLAHRGGDHGRARGQHRSRAGRAVAAATADSGGARRRGHVSLRGVGLADRRGGGARHHGRGLFTDPAAGAGGAR
ncbi:MAG: hypothetical protein ACK559_22870, partial [bacterium]